MIICGRYYSRMKFMDAGVNLHGDEATGAIAGVCTWKNRNRITWHCCGTTRMINGCCKKIFIESKMWAVSSSSVRVGGFNGRSIENAGGRSAHVLDTFPADEKSAGNTRTDRPQNYTMMGLRFHIRQPVFQCKHHKPGHIARIGFLQQVVAVTVYRFHADE